MTTKEKDSKYLLHTYPRKDLEFTHGKNATLFMEDGSDCIDFAAGIGVVSVGHGNSDLADAISKQVSKIIHISNLYQNGTQAELAKRLIELSGIDGRCFFANSGAEANEGAIKIARKYGEDKRYKIITLKNSFHGRTIAALKATGQEKLHKYFGPFPDGFVHADSVAQIKQMVDSETVAVMIELVQGEGGVSPLDKNDVQDLAKFLKEKDVLLIADEVQTGIYRTGEFLASNLYGIKPDVITLAKGLGGGVPIGVTITTHKDIMSVGDHGSTFGGNYLSAVASNKVLDLLGEYKKSGKLDESIAYFKSRCEDIARKHSDLISGETGAGLMRALIAKDEETQMRLIDLAHKHRVLVLRSGRCRVRMLPPLTITKNEIDEGFVRLEKAISEL